MKVLPAIAASRENEKTRWLKSLIEVFVRRFGGFEKQLFERSSRASALDDARALLDWAVRAGIDDAIVPRAQVVLLAPVPVPRQMRDFLSFEQHLRNAREMRFRKMAARAPDPAAAFADYVRRGVVLPPDVWYAQPIYYKCNRFSVIGTDADIRWPGYADVLDYELEFGVFIGKGGANIPAAKATTLSNPPTA